jgi:KaiC/GvpD/RAD55 family RecA-like ATPase
MSDPADASGAEVEPAGRRDAAVEEFVRVLGVSTQGAQTLASAGFLGVDALRAAPERGWRDLGLDPSDLDRVRETLKESTADAADGTASRSASSSPPPRESAGESPRPDDQRVVERWMASARRPDRPRRRSVAPAKDSTDILRKWVEGDDRAMEAWIQASGGLRASRASAPKSGESKADAAGSAAASAATLAAVGGIPAGLREREETVVRWLTELLDRVKSEQFDPRSLLQEFQDFQRELFEERARRKQLEEELEHVKRGSIAVIKYVRGREAKAREEALKEKDREIADVKRQLEEALARPVPAPVAASAPAGEAGAVVPEGAVREVEGRLREEFAEREKLFVEREAELRRRTVQLEGEIRTLRAESEVRARTEIAAGSGSNADEVFEARRRAADARERELVLRENDLRTKFEEIRIRAEEVDRKREPLQYKEKELVSWEQELNLRKQALDLQARQVEEAKAQGVPTEVADNTRRLEQLQSEIAKKEEELRTRETYLHQKMEELEGLERKAVEAEAERMQSEIADRVASAKRKSGVRRLDDLLFGGFPVAAQVLVSGPAHTGLDTLARMFVAEGLKEGMGALWVVTDRTYLAIREDMVAILPSYAEHERQGRVRYVDVYSRGLGLTDAEPSVKLVAPTEKDTLEQIGQAANAAAQELKRKWGNYRLVFESVSTLTAYLDTSHAFRFLQPFVGRRKLEGANAYYLVETGMHSGAEVEAVEHMMDGSIHSKVEQLKTFLSVRGVTDVQSRAWIGYTFGKKSFSLGSFSLDHIR